MLSWISLAATGCAWLTVFVAILSSPANWPFVLMLMAIATSVLFAVLALLWESRRRLGACALAAALLLPGFIYWALSSLELNLN